jgi:hypothetical protein
VRGRAALAASLYCLLLSVAAEGCPIMFGRPDLIQAIVRDTGLCPTYTMTPSRSGLKFMVASASPAGTNPYLSTGASPTLNPALVRQSASASAALAHASHGWFSFVPGFPVAYATLDGAALRLIGERIANSDI